MEGAAVSDLSVWGAQLHVACVCMYMCVFVMRVHTLECLL